MTLLARHQHYHYTQKGKKVTREKNEGKEEEKENQKEDATKERHKEV